MPTIVTDIDTRRKDKIIGIGEILQIFLKTLNRLDEESGFSLNFLF